MDINLDIKKVVAHLFKKMLLGISNLSVNVYQKD